MPPGIGKLNRRTKGGPHCRRGREPAKKRPCGKSGRLPPGIASIVAENDQRFGIAGSGGGFKSGGAGRFRGSVCERTGKPE